MVVPLARDQALTSNGTLTAREHPVLNSSRANAIPVAGNSGRVSSGYPQVCVAQYPPHRCQWKANTMSKEPERSVSDSICQRARVRCLRVESQPIYHPRNQTQCPSAVQFHERLLLCMLVTGKTPWFICWVAIPNQSQVYRTIALLGQA